MSKMGGFGLQYYPYVSFVVIAFLKCGLKAVFGLACAPPPPRSEAPTLVLKAGPPPPRRDGV